MITPRQIFTEQYKQRGWCVLYSEKYTMPRLYNIHSQITPITSLIKRNYQDYLRSNNQQDEDAGSIEAYVLASLPVVSGTRFYPSDKQIFTCRKSGCSFANTYKPFEPQHESINLSPLFHEFFERLFPEESERLIVIQWLAHMVQKPTERPSWHLMLSSDTGTGKGYLFHNILRPIIGDNAAKVDNYSALFEKHSTILESNLLILLDDPKSNNDSTMTKLKSNLSEPSIYVNPKGGNGYSTQTYSRIILASNELRPLRLDANERRFFTPRYINHKTNGDETSQFIKKLENWLMLPGAIESVYNFFNSIDLSNFNHKRIYQTATLKSMIEQSKNCYEDALLEFITEFPVFSFSELKGSLEVAGHRLPQDAALCHFLAEQKYQKARIKVGASQRTYWLPGDMTISEAKDHIR